MARSYKNLEQQSLSVIYLKQTGNLPTSIRVSAEKQGLVPTLPIWTAFA